MSDNAIAKVYAKSFIALGEEQNIAIADEFTKLTEAINNSNDLENVLFLDIFTIEEKLDVFNSVADKLSLNIIVKNIFSFLIQEKRSSLFPLVFKEVIVLDDAKKGFMKGSIEGESAEIDSAHFQKLESYLSSKLGKSVKLNYIQNKNVAAGYRVTVDDFQLDATLDNQLENFKNSVLGE